MNERKLQGNYGFSDLDLPQPSGNIHCILHSSLPWYNPSYRSTWETQGYEVVIVDPTATEYRTVEQLKEMGMVGIVLRAAQQEE